MVDEIQSHLQIMHVSLSDFMLQVNRKTCKRQICEGPKNFKWSLIKFIPHNMPL
jgi:hypothetical protein